ncbi:Hpt domain-containing protein [bacterium]|nr:Hpt domain-containing protein [bacterium]
MSFDYSKLLESAGDDEELAKELIQIFLEEEEQNLKDIAHAIQTKQAEELHHAAHKLKGPLSSMGANTALDQVVALETMGINEDLQQSDVAFERLKKHINVLVRDLTNHDKVSVE